jgi:hypothetical protein
LVLLLAIAAVPLALAAHQGVLYNVGQAATFLPIAAVGVMVAWHRPRNPKDTVDLRSVRDDLATVVDQALEPVRVFVWINDRG